MASYYRIPQASKHLVRLPLVIMCIMCKYLTSKDYHYVNKFFGNKIKCKMISSNSYLFYGIEIVLHMIIIK
jgi:hypothetical protein